MVFFFFFRDQKREQARLDRDRFFFSSCAPLSLWPPIAKRLSILKTLVQSGARYRRKKAQERSLRAPGKNQCPKRRRRKKKTTSTTFLFFSSFELFASFTIFFFFPFLSRASSIDKTREGAEGARSLLHSDRILPPSLPAAQDSVPIFSVPVSKNSLCPVAF